MNYNVMKRPMFKMGGKAASQGTGITSGLDEKVNMTDGRANYAEGPDLYNQFLKSALEKQKQRDEAIADMDSLINMQALGRVGQFLSTEESNNPLEILKNLAMQGTQIALPSLLERKKQELRKTDPKMDLAFAKAFKPTGGFGEKVYNMKLRQLGELETQSANLTKQLNEGLIDKNQFDLEMSKINRRYKLISSQFKTDQDYIAEARASLEGPDGLYPTGAPEDKVLEKAAEIKAIESRILQADGGRVNRAMGSDDDGELPPDPTEPINPFKPKPIKPLGDGKMDVAMETQGRGNQVFDMLRARLPQEITDDVVQLISYNKEAFADFASIKNQEDVTSFNEKYGVQLVIDVATV